MKTLYVTYLILFHCWNSKPNIRRHLWMKECCVPKVSHFDLLWSMKKSSSSIRQRYKNSIRTCQFCIVAFAPNPPTVELKTPQKKTQTSPVRPDEEAVNSVSQIKIDNNKQPVLGFAVAPSVPTAAVPSQGSGYHNGSNASDNKDVADRITPTNSGESLVDTTSDNTPVQTPKKDVSTTQVTKSTSK